MADVNAALGVLHIATGVFYTTAGARKCFLPAVREKVCALFDRYHVPKPCQYMVMAGEFFGGMGILTGCVTRFAALGLLVIMAGAFKLDTWPSIKAKQSGHWSQFLSNALCTAESQLIVILAALALAGAGTFSLDYLMGA